mmetsp:Transcript_22880/g.37655  ORF Transcript_22880/g.37655 Transcript_22880/m.37655 type:complete len:243 (+) Transcript_22880:35-763(+)
MKTPIRQQAKTPLKTPGKTPSKESELRALVPESASYDYRLKALIYALLNSETQEARRSYKDDQSYIADIIAQVFEQFRTESTSLIDQTSREKGTYEISKQIEELEKKERNLLSLKQKFLQEENEWEKLEKDFLSEAATESSRLPAAENPLEPLSQEERDFLAQDASKDIVQKLKAAYQHLDLQIDQLRQTMSIIANEESEALRMCSMAADAVGEVAFEGYTNVNDPKRLIKNIIRPEPSHSS